MKQAIKGKILNALLIATSLAGYLEWGGNNQSFLFQVEGELLSKLLTDPLPVLHPFTILPLIGQVLLLITLFQKSPSKILTYIGITGIGVLFLLIAAIGVMTINLKILCSAIPFIIVAVVTIRHYRNRKAVEPAARIT